MATGYDCPGLLNLGLFRPTFLPTDFIQIKGRSTLKHNFLQELFDEDRKELVNEPRKTSYKLFDFFANCEYFEEASNYDEVLKLPKLKEQNGGEPGGGGGADIETYEHVGNDILKTMCVEQVTEADMKIDRMFYAQFEDTIRENSTIVKPFEGTSELPPKPPWPRENFISPFGNPSSIK